MTKKINRRKFLGKSLAGSAAVTLGLNSFEEKQLLAALTAPKKDANTAAVKGSAKKLPTGTIGNVKITRLICGGNLINGYAHSRDLIYVSDLMKHYFTDEKVLETLALAQENGINTLIANTWTTGKGSNNTIRIMKEHWKRGGKLQWLAQCKVTKQDVTGYLKMAIDNGAVGAFIHGGAADKFVKNQQVDLIGQAVSFVKKNNLIAGVAGHSIDVPIAVETAGIEPDFYMKTLNTVDYWSATPEQTIEFMKEIKRPWIAYKVLGAGAIEPEEGFRYAFENGADFIVAGMFDFQIEQDTKIAMDILSRKINRQRPWAA
jgi:hypothetical protein